MKPSTRMVLTAAALLGGLAEPDMAPVWTLGKPGEGGREAEPTNVPELTVRAIRFDRAPKPTGLVRIWRWRKKAWRVGEPMDANDVQWSRLMMYDRVEILKPQTESEEPTP